MARKVLAKKISRKDAMAYRQTVPNPIGVTTLAAVNGPGAYAQRYEATRELLGQPSSKASSRRGASRRRKAASNRKSAPTQRRKRMRKGTMKRNRMSKQQYMRRLAGKGLSQAQREGLWKGYRKICTSKPKRKKRVRRNASASSLSPNRRKRTTAKRATSRKRTTTKRKTQRRVYGKGKYRALRARVGSRNLRTYAYQTPSGRIRKIPKHGYLGYASSAEMRSAHRKDPKRADRDNARWASAMKRREKASISAVEGRGSAGLFTPNRRRRRPTRTITFEEWEREMKQNRRRRKKTTKKRRTRRNVSQVAANRRRRRKTTKARKTARKSVRRRVRRNARKSVAANRRRRSTSRRRRATSSRRKSTSRRRVRRNARRSVAANRRRRTTRRKSTSRRRVQRRRRTLRNQAMTFGKQLLQVLKIGGVVVVGYVAHRALSRVVSDSLLSKVSSLQSGTGAAYRDVIAGALVAAVGVPVAAKVAPGDAKMLGAGMAASLLQNAIVTVLSQMGQDNVAAYLGDYTNAEGSPQYSGYGSYYEFTPGQVFGEYYSTPGMSGFGAVPQLYQAAAGQFPGPGIAHLQQEAAGFGQPALMQAAAGAGEYIVQGAAGIGEYEEVVPQYQRPVRTDEGVSPDLSSAERALDIAEAAAGVGATNLVPLQSTVYPTGTPEAIPDMPGGSRAGIFAGQNGAFGPAH